MSVLPLAVRSQVRPVAPIFANTILWALATSHLLNDILQALIPALYPLFKQSFELTFAQIGMITFTFQIVGSVLQPLVGLYTDRHPRPYALAGGMAISLCGLVFLALASGYAVVLLAAGMIGLGSAIFHPEASRMARAASGGRHGFAQSLFQVGGNAGTSLGPLLAAWIIVPHGQVHVLWFTILALVGIFILTRTGTWYASTLVASRASGLDKARGSSGNISGRVFLALFVLLMLMFSKFVYLASMSSYYTFYLIHQFGVSIQESQHYLFLFLIAGTVGTFLGGVLGDRVEKKAVLWFSILGVAPFALVLPYANLFWTACLSGVIGLIMASAFPAILVYATELLPNRVGLIAGLCFGLAFGIAGIGSAVLGRVADATSIGFVMKLCSLLPLIGLLTALLPDTNRPVGKPGEK